mgnify:CR=1 FL=1
MTTIEKTVEKIAEKAKSEEQFEKWETMRKEAKRRQRGPKAKPLLAKNKTFPTQFGEETPDANEALMFWRAINNKAV